MSKPKNNEKTFPTPDDSKATVSDKKLSESDPITIETIANLIKDKEVKNIIVMTGAGISTAAGIPDFRTPGKGLYDNLSKYDLPYPEAIFDIGFFRKNPVPFFVLAKELYPGNFFPTLAHYFLLLLHHHNVLLRCFTQNIDTLERLTDLPSDLIVEAHGSFAESRCLNCKRLADPEWMRHIVDSGKIPSCTRCNLGIVKPCITFFGEMLPALFYQRLSDFEKCDLLIVIGTSLKVQPFANLINSVNETTPRLLINLEKVGESFMPGSGFDFEGKYNKNTRDIFFQSTCDEGIKKIAKLCGWEDQLQKLYIEGHKVLEKKYRVKTTIKLESSEISEDGDVQELVKAFDKIEISKEVSKEASTVTITETKLISIERKNKDKVVDKKNDKVNVKNEKVAKEDTENESIFIEQKNKDKVKDKKNEKIDVKNEKATKKDSEDEIKIDKK